MSRLRYHLVWLLVPLVLVGQHAPVGGQDSPPQSPPEVVRFRRENVPNAALNAILNSAKATEDFRPVRREEFKRLIAATSGRQGSPIGQNPHVVSSEFHATLKGNVLIGKADLHVIQTSSQVGLVDLEPMRLAVRDPIWKSDSLPAVVGLSHAGRSAAVVEKTDNLLFDWNLRGVNRTLEGTLFDLAVPECATTRIVLDLPAGQMLTSSKGIVSKIPALQNPPATADGADQERWLVELGGQSQTQLRVAPQAMQVRTQQVVFVRQFTDYQLRDDGLEVSARLDLNVFHEPLSQLELDVAEGLQVDKITVNSEPVEWTVAGMAGAKVVIQIPKPAVGAVEVVAHAVGPVTLGERWELPTMRLSSGFWRQGQATVRVHDSLMLQSAEVKGGRQSRVAVSPTSTEEREFQFYDPSGQIDVLTARRPLALQVAAGTRIEIGEQGYGGRVTADIKSIHGETFELFARLAPSWQVDSVDPAELVRDYEVLPASGGQPRRLRIHLANAVIPRQQLVRVIVRGHSPQLQRAPIAGERLRMLTFESVQMRRNLFHVVAERNSEVNVSGDHELNRMTFDALSDKEVEQLSAVEGGLYFIDERAVDDIRVQSNKERVFSGSLNVDVDVQAEATVETYHVECRPESGRIERLLVHLRRKRSQPVTWMLVGEANEELTARLLTEAEQRRVGISGGETFELKVQTPRNSAFRVEGLRTIPGKEPHVVCLALLHEAVSQVGSVTIRSSENVPLEYDNGGLHAIPSSATPLDRFSSDRAKFAYDPVQAFRVVVSRRDETSNQPVWAWTTKLRTRLTKAGASHTLLYQLENAGAREFTVTFPAGMRIDTILVQDTPVPIADATPGRFTIPLPLGRRYPTVEIRYHSEVALGPYALVQNVLPQPSLPELDFDWLLWVPPEYQVAGQGRSSWWHRLLGPLVSADGRGGAGEGRANWLEDAETAAARLDDYLAEFIDDGREDVTWRELLSRYGDEARQNALPQIVVDQRALRRAGIRSDSRVVPTQTLSAVRASLLLRNNLTFWAHRGVLVLTAKDAAVSMASRRPAASPYFLGFTAMADATPFHFLPVEIWGETSNEQVLPWAERPLNSFASLGEREWQQHAVSLVPWRQSQVLVVSRMGLRWAWVSCILVAAGLTLMFLGRRPRLILAVLVTAGVVSLQLPAPWFVLGTSTFLGTSLALMIVVLRRRPASIPPATFEISHSGSAVIPLMTALLIALLFVIASVSSAQQPTNKTAVPKRVKIHRVLNPVVKDGDKWKPVDDYVYMPNEFYVQLKRLVSSSARLPAGWLLTDAEYATEFIDEDSDPALRVVHLNMSVRTLGDNQRVSLPFDAAQLRIEESEIDGVAQVVSWDEASKKYQCVVAEAGFHLIEAELHLLEGEKEESQISFTAPPIAASRLRVASRGGVSSLSSPSSLGQMTTDLVASETVFDVGPSQSIEIQWSRPDSEPVVSMVTAEQYSWLQIKPNEVVLLTQFNFDISGKPIEEVEILADRRLLFSFDSNDKHVVRRKIREGDFWRFYVRLDEPKMGRFSLPLRFYLSETSGIGRLDMPFAIVEANRLKRHWVAASISPLLQYESELGDDLESIVAADFAAAWRSETSPDLAYDATGQRQLAWNLATRFRVAKSTVDERIGVSVDRKVMNLIYEGRIETTDGTLQQHRVHLPSEMVVASVSVLDENGVERVIRSARGPDGDLDVFLSGETAGEQTLVLRGETPLTDSRFAIPDVHLENAQRQDLEVRLYRRERVLIKVSPEPADPMPQDNSRAYEAGLGRLHQVFQFDVTQFPNGQVPPVHVEVSKNDPKVSARLITTLNKDGNNWTATLQYQVRATGPGIIDMLRLEIPETLTDVEPGANVSSRLRAVNPRIRQLIMWPKEADQKEISVTVRGTLTAAPGRVRVPEVRSLDATDAVRYIVLPTQLENEEIEWELRGLQPVPANDPVRQRISEGTEAHIVALPRFQATIGRVSRTAGVPQVRLLDVQLGQQQRYVFGVATFDVDAAERDKCVLRLPAAMSLVHVRVASLPATIKPLGNSRWAMELGPDQLPQRIEVVFHTELPLGAEEKAFNLLPPKLEGFQVLRTVWSLSSADSQVKMLNADLVENNRWSESFVRLQLLDQLIQASTSVTTENSAMRTEDWYLPWARRFINARKRLARMETRYGSSPAEMSELDSMDTGQKEIAKALKTSDARDQLWSGPVQFLDHQELCEFVLGKRTRLQRRVFEKAEANIQLQIQTANQQGRFERMVASVGLVFFGMLVVWGHGRFRAFRRFCDSPVLLALALAMVWWVFLTPGWLGLVCAGAIWALPNRPEPA